MGGIDGCLLIMDIAEQIQQQTELIAELESSYPPYNADLDRWHKDNRPHEIHHVKIRDAYWKRRMLQTKLEGGDLSETAKVY